MDIFLNALLILMIILLVVVLTAFIEYGRPLSKLVFHWITPKLVELKRESLNKESPFLEVEKSLWVAESENAFAIKDYRPRAPHHYLVIPKERRATLLDTEVELLGEMLALCKTVAQNAGIAEHGFRIVINTNPQGLQTVYHLHMHVLGGRQMRLPVG